jgi:predicted RNA-binding protein
MKTEKVYTQHEENKEWMNSLLFYRDEIKVMENRLQEIASKNTSKEVLARVEHFQNQLVVQKETIDTIKHEINLSNDVINAEVNKNLTAIGQRKIKDHSVLRDNMESFEKIFKSLKGEFNTFLSKWM